MSLLRPEARAQIARWREAALGGIVMAAGLYWFATIPGLLRWPALGLAALGAMLTWTGIQRARFHRGAGGLGVVQVNERQITYLAPVGGGFASLDALTRVEIAPDRAGLPVWRFASPGAALVIPVNAERSEVLFEALTQLPGVNMEAAIRAAGSRPDRAVLIWQKAHPNVISLSAPPKPPKLH